MTGPSGFDDGPDDGPGEPGPDPGPYRSGAGEGSRAGPGKGAGTAGEVGQALAQGIKSALARWVLVKRRARSRSSPSPRDEATHSHAPGSPGHGRLGRSLGALAEEPRSSRQPRHFAEDYAFAGVQAGLGVVVRLEQLPGRDAQRVWVVLLRPDGAWALRGGQLVLRTEHADRWRAGGLQLDCETPLHRWTLRFSGPLERAADVGGSPSLRVVGADDPHVLRGSVDLTFVSTAVPYVPGTDDDPELLARCLGQATWDARLLRAARRDRSRGYVQLGELHGTVALGDVLVPVRAASLRQHHWGVRDWGACDEAFQLLWATDDERRGWLHHARFPFVTLEGGFVAHRGRSVPVRSLGATWQARPRGAPAHASLAVGEAEGLRTLQLEHVSDLSFVVDGRGRVDLALVRVSGARSGWGLWAGLRRALPRR